MSMPSETATYVGRLSDGQSAAQSAVTVALRDDGLEFWINVDDYGRPRDPGFWSYDKLTTAEPMRSGQNDVLVQYPEVPGATLYVSDAEFVRGLAGRARHTSHGAWLWRFTRPALAILAVMLGLVATFWYFDPSPARVVANLMPNEMRQRLADGTLNSLTDRHGTCTAQAGKAATQKMLSRLLSGRPDIDTYRVQVLDWKLENAFALPGRNMILTRGLIESAGSAEEVAGVLAHEIGHVDRLHPEVGAIRAMGISLAAQFLFAGGAETVGNIGSVLVMFSYSRAAEREADKIGLDILRKTEIPAAPLAGFFERLLKKHGSLFEKIEPNKSKKGKKSESDKETTFQKNVSRSLKLLSTHPPSRERVRDIRARGTYPTRPVLTKQEWADMQAICGKTSKPKKKPYKSPTEKAE